MMLKPNDDEWGPTGIFNPVYKGKELYVNANPNIRKNFDTILSSMTKGAFSKKEMNQITREIIDNISKDDAKLFEKVMPGKDGKIRLNPGQMGAVRRMINTFPQDDLGIRVRNAYDSLNKDQRIGRGQTR